MSGTTLRAALELRLEDKLTAGLNSLKGILSGLRDAGRQLTLGRLEQGGDVLRRVSSEAVSLVGHLKHIVTNADAAHAALGRMGTAVSNWSSKTFGPESRIGALGAAAQGFSVIAPMREYASFENIARHSAITEGFSGAAANAETQRLMAMFQKDALEAKQSSTSIAQAYQDLIQTGMTPEMAEKLLPIHSRAATAYNIDPEALGHAVAALQMNLGIGENDMAGALASMALASKSGRFKVEDFSRFLPGITGNLSSMGMKGRGAADLAFAALETIMKNSADPSTGATDFADFMNYISSPTAARAMAFESKGLGAEARRFIEKHNLSGLDLYAVKDDARAKGIDPITAILGTLQAKFKGLPPDVMRDALGAFFHNQQARDAVMALLQHKDDLLSLRAKLGGADTAMMGRDYATAADAPQKNLDLAMEQLTQLGRTAGNGFLPILLLINSGLSKFNGLLNGLDHMLPGVKSDFLLLVGGTLSFGAAVGAIGFVMPTVIAGANMLWGVLRGGWSVLRLLGNAGMFVIDALAGVLGVSTVAAGAIIGAVLLIAAAAYDIYANWDQFKGYFETMWQGVEDVFNGFKEFLFGVFNLDLDRAIAGWQQMMHGAGEIFGGALDIIKQLFLDLFNTVDGWTGGALLGTFHAIRDAVGGIIDKIREWIELLKNGAVGRLLGVSDKPAAAGDKPAGGADDAGALAGAGLDPSGLGLLMPSGKVSVTVGVDDSGKLVVKQASSDSASVKVNAPAVNPGQTLGRH